MEVWHNKETADELKRLIEAGDLSALITKIREVSTSLLERDDIDFFVAFDDLAQRLSELPTETPRRSILEILKNEFPEISASFTSDVMRPDIDIDFRNLEFTNIGETLVPPDTDRYRFTFTGSGNFTRPSFKPRAELTGQLLSEMGVDLNECKLFEGKNEGRMFRTLSYQVIVSPHLDKTILICDEENNRSFVVYTAEKVERLYRMKKSELAELVKTGIADDLIWCDSEEWKLKLRELLAKNMKLTKEQRRMIFEVSAPHVPSAPEGWITQASLANQVGYGEAIVKNAKEKFRKNHPEWFREYRDVIGHIREHFAPELVIKIIECINRIEKAPEGWMNTWAMTKEMKVSYTRVKNFVKPYRKTNPEWFETYRDSGNQPVEHFSPELADIIRQDLICAKPAAKGWLTQSAIQKEIGVHYEWLKEKLKRLTAEHPEWRKKYYDQIGHTREHYAPELIQYLIDERNKIKPAPDGWKTAASTLRNFRRTYTNVQTVADEVLKEHPEWTGVFRNPGYRIARYLHPECIAEIKARIKRRKEKQEKERNLAPDGWMTCGGIAMEMNVSIMTVKRLADKHKEEHLEWFAEYDTPHGQKREHYAPNLISIINQVLTIPNAPDGWMNNFALAKHLDCTRALIETTANPYREIRPEWFKRYRSQNNQLLEHYSPELCALIKQKIEKYTEPPEGWVLPIRLANEINETREAVKKVTEKHRESHPEWFGKFREKGILVTEYIDPELTEIIKKELSRVEKAPEGWLTAFGLTEVVDVSYTTIRKLIDDCKETHPHLIQTYRDDIGHPRDHCAPALVGIIEERIKEGNEPAPEEWITHYELAKHLNIKPATLREHSNVYREEHPEWFKKFTNKHNRPVEHYSPELIAILKEKLAKLNGTSYAPEGWLTANGLGKVVGQSKQVKEIIEEHRLSHPEWFKEYRDQIGHIREHHSPELIQAIQEKKKETPVKQEGSIEMKWAKIRINLIEETETAPEGWLNTLAAAKELGVSRTLINKSTNPYRESNPEWFKQYRNKVNQTQEHFSPALIEVIRAEINKHEKAPDGWMTNKSLSKALGANKEPVRNIAERERGQHPEWFGQYRNMNNTVREHYAPELIELIINEFSRYEKAPDGWMTISALTKATDSSHSTVKRRVDKYREKNPEWFKEYLDAINHAREHIAPELATIITEELNA